MNEWANKPTKKVFYSVLQMRKPRRAKGKEFVKIL